MSSNATSETLSVTKDEFQGWLREVVREVLREELRPWRDVAEMYIKPGVGKPPGMLGDVLETEFFGMWRERDDMPDSSVLARSLREKAWRRG